MTPFVRVAASTASRPAQAAKELSEQIGAAPASLVCFFAGTEIDFGELSRCVDAAFGAAHTVGCTTCGEIGPAGCTVGAVSALALAPPCRTAAVLLDDLSHFRFEQAERALAELADQLDLGLGELNDEPHRRALVTLTDGLSGREEILIAGLGTFAPAVPLVGGSAADDFRFTETRVAVDGRSAADAAAVVLLEPNVPFHPFHLHHFEPTDESVVVTEAEPERRLIHRIDGRPAIETAVRVMGIAEERLRADPLGELGNRQTIFGIRAGQDVFIRSVMNLRGDSLLMGGAVEEGTVLWPMRAGDIVAVTSAGIAQALHQVDSPSGMLLFNCGGRMWEATSRGLVDELARAMRPIPAAGFTTYGEQYGPLQVNQTLTGLAFGCSDDR